MYNTSIEVQRAFLIPFLKLLSRISQTGIIGPTLSFYNQGHSGVDHENGCIIRDLPHSPFSKFIHTISIYVGGREVLTYLHIHSHD